MSASRLHTCRTRTFSSYAAAALLFAAPGGCGAPTDEAGRGPAGSRYWSFTGPGVATLGSVDVTQLTREGTIVWGAMRYPVFSVGETESHDAAHSVLNRAHSSLLDPTWHSALNESPPCDHRDPGLLYVTFTPANVGPTADDYLHAPLGYDQEFELCAENATRLGMEDLRSLAFELGVRLQELRGPPQICAPPRCTAP